MHNLSFIKFGKNTTFENKTIFLDVDGTLVPDGGTTMDHETLSVLRILSEKNNVFLASNGNAERTKYFASLVNAKALPRMRKPFLLKGMRSTYRRAASVVVGDKFITDGLFAKMIGAQFVYIKPLRATNERIISRVAYMLDRVVQSLWHGVRLMRPSHWVKNLLVFAPLVFAGEFFIGKVVTATATFFIFSLTASLVYIFNDIFDRAQDRVHPEKRHRPIASGSISVYSVAVLVSIIGVIVSILLFIYPILIPIILLYVVFNVAYTIWLKHIAVLDILTVSSFYLMRVFAGGIVVAVPLSPWIIICTLFASLFLVTGKRRAEFSRDARRKVLADYSREALDFILAVSAAVAIMSYGSYSIFGHRSVMLVYSIIPVVFIFLRILNRIYTHPAQAEAPERMMSRDPLIIIALVVWVGVVSSSLFLGW